MELNKKRMELLRSVYVCNCDFDVGEWFAFLESVGICFIEKENLYFITDKEKCLLAIIKYGL